MIAVCLILQLLLVVGAVQFAGRERWRRIASGSLVTAAFVLPLCSPPVPLARLVMSYFALLALVKVVQLARARGHWPARLRLWHGLAPFDVRSTRRVSPALDVPRLVHVLVFASLAAGALLGLVNLSRLLPAWLEIVRLVLGALLVYCAMDAITGSVVLVHRLVGIGVPPIQDHPILSRSIREFWSTRWNRPVSRWLNDLVFVPISRRRGLEVGLFATFCVSALFHAWLFFTAVGFGPALMVGVFFLSQALFVLGESAAGILKMRPGLRRLWTLGMLGVASPLFVEPTLRVLHL